MKLLLDQNLSFKLVPFLSDAFPGSKHLRDFDLTREDDEPIWNFAAENGFSIVSKDADFMHRALLRGHPPKLIHLRLGNCPSSQIRALLLAQEAVIRDFLLDPLESLLTFC
jgi:predicted nuclease of predicted toxin-antitoxin system